MNPNPHPETKPESPSPLMRYVEAMILLIIGSAIVFGILSLIGWW